MSQKKHKKRQHSPTVAAKRQAQQARIAEEMSRSRNRMNPAARNLLLGNLVFLALAGLLERNGLIPTAAAGVCTILGIILLITALWLQFGRRGDDHSSGGSPRL